MPKKKKNLEEVEKGCYDETIDGEASRKLKD